MDVTDREFVLWLMGLLDAPVSPGQEAELLDRVRSRLGDVRPALPVSHPHSCDHDREGLTSSCPRGSSSGVLDNEAAVTD
jgi:hypothetical protein